MKLLLMPVFLSPLLNNLVCRPMEAELILGLLACDFARLPAEAKSAYFFLYIFLTYLELMIIAAVSVFRAAAVWASNAHGLSVGLSAFVVTGITIYTFLVPTTVLLLKSVRYIQAIILIINCVLPILTTMACYVAMLFAVRRNRQRLTEVQSRSSLKIIDNATRAMIAVFVSNLVFGLPFCISQLLRERISRMLLNFIYVIYNTHLMVDPLVFIFFNYSHRKRVCQRIRTGWRWAAGLYKVSMTKMGASADSEQRTDWYDKSVSFSLEGNDCTPEDSSLQNELRV
ncbi:uncharacterized protein LOC122242587 isoform X2 [Penaeus japonicus]|nr:uncharacterized protein LOC122242587 isoform X2 [Penaeus japonicus]XP_042855847.1 uncharacterized protein LOC122242587 isoform X2 [Penaeus japonicus]